MRTPEEIACEVLVAGGGLGGVAAALRAARLGRTVCLLEETGWLGGQISAQGVSHLDEHEHIETFGGTRAYYDLRNAIRDYYRTHYALTPEARRAPRLNPGNAWVSRLSFEPRVGAAVLDAMVAGLRGPEELRIFRHTVAVEAEGRDGRIISVTARQAGSATLLRFRPAYVLDATDLGDLFVLTQTPYAAGAESRAETGEPSAPERADPACVQDFTFPFAVEFRPGEVHTIARPAGYEENRARQPYSFAAQPRVADAPAYRMFEAAPGTYGPFFTYRRVLDARNFDDPRVPNDVAIINWPSNDFRGGSLIDRAPDEQARLCEQARRLSLGFLYWLQTEAQRDDGGRGYPELRPRPDIVGSADGLSQVPYIREGRRLRARRTIREQDIARTVHPGARAARFDDAVGIGFYPIDLHGCEAATASIPTRPFQIPLGALVSVRTLNLIPAAKNIGTTRIANGAYRLHPVEWAVGEAAAALADFCLRAGTSPQEVLDRPDLVRQLQLRLIDQGIPLYWYDDVPLDHPAFAATQLLAIDGVWEGDTGTLHFAPQDAIAPGEARQRVTALARALQRWGGAAPPRHVAEDRATRGDLAVWLGRLLREAIERGAPER